ncbi:MAG TPA: PKD domain-containing protein [Thermoanaerobaculia bacterium]
MIKSSVAVSLLFVTLSVAPLFAQEPSEALLQDAASYASFAGVSVDEAVRRLQLQKEAGDLEAALTEEERATFAGLWIEHQPQFRVVVRFTDRASEERLRARVGRGPLADLIETRAAKWSLADLERRVNEGRGQARGAGVAADHDINIFENRAELYVVDTDKLNAGLARARTRIPDGVLVKRVPRLATFEALTGGVPINGCTSGFTVQAPNGELGVSTAGHCPDQQFFQGLNLPFRAQDNAGEQDVQWNSACDIVQVTNQFETGIGLRSCIGTRHRNNQVVNSLVWKYGRTTGRTWGKIESKSFNGTFVRVDGDATGMNLSEPGDSGGPWFVEDLAYGIHQGAPGDDADDSIYMPINYISSIGVSVLTYNPGACNFAPVPNFTYTRTFGGGVNFNASSSFDPDGTIVRYEWNFDDGSTAVTTSPLISHPYPKASNTYWVTLVVQDNEGKRTAVSKEVVLCYLSDGCGGPIQ